MHLPGFPAIVVCAGIWRLCRQNFEVHSADSFKHTSMPAFSAARRAGANTQSRRRKTGGLPQVTSTAQAPRLVTISVRCSSCSNPTSRPRLVRDDSKEERELAPSKRGMGLGRGFGLKNDVDASKSQPRALQASTAAVSGRCTALTTVASETLEYAREIRSSSRFLTASARASASSTYV